MECFTATYNDLDKLYELISKHLIRKSKTMICAINNYHKFYVRINGIDTCEIHSKDDKIKELGLKAKYRLASCCNSKLVSQA